MAHIIFSTVPAKDIDVAVKDDKNDKRICSACGNTCYYCERETEKITMKNKAEQRKEHSRKIIQNNTLLKDKDSTCKKCNEVIKIQCVFCGEDDLSKLALYRDTIVMCTGYYDHCPTTKAMGLYTYASPTFQDDWDDCDDHDNPIITCECKT